MNEEYKKWYSHNLNHDFEMLVFGHDGYPLIIFPTSMGRYYGQGFPTDRIYPVVH